MPIFFGMCVSIVAMLFASLSLASGGSGQGTISYLYQRNSDGLLGIYKEGGVWNNPDDCDRSDRIILTRDDPSRSEFYSAILASKMSGRPFAAYMGGCVEWNGYTYPKIKGVYTY